ncbi:MAG TPA: tetratricopeptide repeat protein [Pyrinomonadaceae bacterium]|nr:tetratricopeptide repeat protein [Pyrinomonadaceae bacterium]
MTKLHLVLTVAAIGSVACYSAKQAERKPTSASPSSTVSTVSSPSGQTVSTSTVEEARRDFEAKNFDKSESALKEIVSKEPKNAEAQYLLGKVYIAKKDKASAVAPLREAAKLDYKSVEKLKALGDVYFDLGRFDNAIVEYGKIPGYEPNNAEAYFNMGRTYVKLGNKIAARQQLKKLDSLNKDFADKLRSEMGE